ncbi:hypothetical protein G7Z17_g4725 [Cylindrodendrum hubeiense]|uniref:Uncharacterized protein n=1 Tax=Cylindrodendrum hubeiense TaxID=595255 RepID=A0A9P5HDD5_9HYPO|nr:hypothetical protein G7Z17_g4725 [Cylindrodendrum hubeiense]
MTTTLGGDGIHDSGGPAENDSEDEVFNVSLLWREDEIECESDDPVSSEDECEEELLGIKCLGEKRIKNLPGLNRTTTWHPE